MIPDSQVHFYHRSILWALPPGEFVDSFSKTFEAYIYIRGDMAETRVDFAFRFPAVRFLVDDANNNTVTMIEEALGYLVEQIWCKSGMYVDAIA